MTIDIEEEDRQIIMMALAHLSRERPGFDSFIRGIANKFENLRMLEMFIAINRDDRLDQIDAAFKDALGEPE